MTAGDGIWRKPDARIAIIGAGLGGCAAAALLQQLGYRPQVYEQSGEITRLGAGIHLSPNVTRILRRIGVLDRLLAAGSRPRAWVSRDWDTGRVTLEYLLADRAEEKFGAPYLTVHRGDLALALVSAVRPESLHLGKRMVDLEQRSGGTVLCFEDGSRIHADVVIGADGVHSKIREVLFGVEAPIYTGHVAHRAIIPVSRYRGHVFGDSTKWWSPESHIVVYYITRERSHIYFVTGCPEPDWCHDDWVYEGDPSELRRHFQGYHDEVQMLLSQCDQVLNWAMLERRPFEVWHAGPIVMLGDACHPMKPHMGQGGAMAIEDAAMLARCIGESGDDFPSASRLYTANRRERTAKVQHYSHHNDWLQYTETSEPDWVFAYDVFDVPLVQPDEP